MKLKFKKFYQTKSPNFDTINRALFEELRDHAISSVNKKGINKILLMTDEELEMNKFYERYQHLK